MSSVSQGKDRWYSVLIGVLCVVSLFHVWLLRGTAAYTPGIAGLWHYEAAPLGVVPNTHQYATLAVPVATAAIGRVCFAAALLAFAGIVFSRFLRKLRLPVVFVKGVYAIALLSVCAALWLLHARPQPGEYAAALPVRATVALQRPSSAAPTESVAPDLTLHFACMYEPCGVQAGQGCTAYANGSAFDRLLLRRDEQRGFWVFDSGAAQLVFRDGDFACVHPSYEHVMSEVRPPTSSYACCIALIVIATLLLSGLPRDTSLRRARVKSFAVLLACSSALYPMLPALLTAWS